MWYQDSKSPKKVQVKFREKYGRNAKVPAGRAIKMWYEKFKKTRSCLSQKRKRNPAVDRPKGIEEFQERPRQSLRRAANNMEIS